MSDTADYQRLALNLINGHGFSLSERTPYRPDMVRTPGYPVFVALWLQATSPHAWAGLAVLGALLGGLTALLAGVAAFRVGGSLRAAAVASLLVAVDLTLVQTDVTIGTESLFTVLLTASTCLLIRPATTLTPYLGAGLCLAAAALTRPFAFYLSPLLAAVVVATQARAAGSGTGSAQRGRRRRVLAGALLLVFAAMLPPGLWIVRNGLATSVYDMSLTPALSLLYGRAPEVLEEAQQLPPGAGARRMAQIAAAAVRDAEARGGQPFNWEQKVEVGGAAAAGVVLRHPWISTRRAAAAAVTTFLSVASHGLRQVVAGRHVRLWQRLCDPQCTPGQLRRLPVALQATFGLAFVALAALYLLAARGAVVLWRSRQRLALGVLVATVTLLVVAGATAYGVARYRVPAVPALAILAGFGVTAPWRRQRRPG